MNVYSGYKYLNKFKIGLQWHMMEAKHFISKMDFEFKKKENGDLVAFCGLSVTFRLSIKKIYFFQMPMTSIKKRYHLRSKPKTEKKPEQRNKTTSIPPNLHLFN